MRLADARELAGDPRTRTGSPSSSARFWPRLAQLQEDALFTGEYDAGAVLTISAGTGGTDAQDWARWFCACTNAGPPTAGTRSS